MRWEKPALLTRTSRPLKPEVASAIIACTSLARETSVRTNRAAPPSLAIASATRRPFASFTSATTTRAPSRAKRVAIASPNPDPPPVTTAIFPSNRMRGVLRRARSGRQRESGCRHPPASWCGPPTGALVHRRPHVRWSLLVTRSWQRPLTVGLLLTVVCVAFEGLAVTTVMPTAVRELGGLLLYGWAFSAFMLANVVGIALAGERIDRHGPRGPMAAGLALFALGLLGGGVAPSMGALIAARAVQGFGAGELSSVIYAGLARSYPAAGQPRMLARLATAW